MNFERSRNLIGDIEDFYWTDWRKSRKIRTVYRHRFAQISLSIMKVGKPPEPACSVAW